MVEAILLTVFPLLMAYAAFSDLLTMTIPNRVPLLLVSTFLLVAFSTGTDAHQMLNHVAALATVLVICFVLFAWGGLGGGDAKLLAAIALWFGYGPELLTFLVYTTLIGGGLTLLLLQVRTPVGFALVSRFPMTHNLTDASKGIPYAIAIGAAGLICYSRTPMMQQVLAAMAAG